jgi:hypothetical protein
MSLYIKKEAVLSWSGKQIPWEMIPKREEAAKVIGKMKGRQIHLKKQQHKYIWKKKMTR